MAGPDLSIVTAVIDLGTVTIAVLQVAVALIMVYIVRKGVKMVTAAVLGSGGDDPGSREYWSRMTDEEKSFLQVSSYEEFSARYRVD